MAGRSSDHLSIAMQYIRSAIELDNNGKVKEAYHCYLNSMSVIVNTLMNESSNQDFPLICKEETIKLLKLIQQCQERAFFIISSYHKNAQSAPGTARASDVSLPLDTSGTARFGQQNDIVRTGKDLANSGHLDRLIMSLPTPPAKKSPNLTPRRTKSVNSVDKIQSRQMFNAYQRRLSIQRHQQDKNFTTFRKTVEDMIIEKARRKALNQKLAERREKLRLKAEERFCDKTGSRSTDAAQEKKIYEKILEFEQETTWPQKLREQLTKDPENIQLIEDIVKTVLSAREHPLGQQLAEIQYSIYRELSLFIGNFSCPIFKLEEDDLCRDCNKTIGDAEHENEAERVDIEQSIRDKKADIQGKENLTEKGQEDLVAREPPNLHIASESENENTHSREVCIDSNTHSKPFEEFKLERKLAMEAEESAGNEESKRLIDSIERFAVPLQSDEFDIAFHDLEESMMENFDSEDFELLPALEVAVLGDVVGESEDGVDKSGGSGSQVERNAKSKLANEENILESTHKEDQMNSTDNGSNFDQSAPCVDNGSSNSNIGSHNNEEEEYHENLQDSGELDKNAEGDFISEGRGISGLSKDEQPSDIVDEDNVSYKEVNEEGDTNEKNEIKHIVKSVDEISNPEDVVASEKEHMGGEDIKIIESSKEGEVFEVNKDHGEMKSNDAIILECEKCHSECSCRNRSHGDTDEVTDEEGKENLSNETYGNVGNGSYADEATNVKIGSCELGNIENEIVDELFNDDNSEDDEVLKRTNLQKEIEDHAGKEDPGNNSTGVSSNDKGSFEADTDLSGNCSEGGDSKSSRGTTATTKTISKNEDEFSNYRTMRNSLELRRNAEKIVKDIHTSLGKIHSLLIITYDELNLPVGRDQSYAATESTFFKPLWQWVNLFFRRLNVQKEITLHDVIKKRWHCGPAEFSVRDKFMLNEVKANNSNYPYKSAVEELKKITSYSSPLDKLECIVVTTKLICQCVTDYWTKKGDSEPPSVGCDDLLPILSYVIVKSAMPQLVSECHAMEEFIQESYLLGEEGYCLTTLATALAYSLSLKENEMPDKAVQ